MESVLSTLRVPFLGYREDVCDNLLAVFKAPEHGVEWKINIDERSVSCLTSLTISLFLVCSAQP